MGDISQNFSYKEFYCRCGCGFSNNKSVKKNAKRVAELLQKIRDIIGVSININSAYRCPSHNAYVGSGEYSLHPQGRAVDIWADTISPQKMAELGIKVGFKGIGVYPTFTHLDTRFWLTRW